ncbi:LacI family transcriptional regulator [Prosthecobacter fusiformis]|uniref:LacI family transcriptional regulator n=1 Tax=Prosthecobacter fusiformis TaxID=48464 RepID=A0A4R7STA2_9BACT|nr:LacI family DNA-binding transcriptional regulator [Prosthecobacter fusiformis]TDU81726.1 LacI family transcriptional regulator [Prosthecobacter fusiformis]
MKNRISQRDLALMAGVSPMTVSLALRGHSSIPEATRVKIRKLAEKHRYRPDPALAALNAYRIQGRTRQFQGTLSWLTTFSTADGWRGMIHAEGYFHGAEVRANELGYQLEPFWLNEPGLSPKRAAQILLARGIQGIIIAPLPVTHGEIKFDWKPFSSVALGYSLRQPQMHVVMNHQSRNMKQTVHRLHALGYQRIGLALPSANNARVDQNYLSGYLIAQRETGGESLEPLLADVFDAPTFQSWLDLERPDSVIVSPAWINQVTEWLANVGLKVPKHIGLAAASIPDMPNAVSGMDEDPALIGRMAVDAVVGMIQRQECGVPARPWSLLAEGVWSPGKTVRRIKLTEMT